MAPGDRLATSGSGDGMSTDAQLRIPAFVHVNDTREGPNADVLDATLAAHDGAWYRAA